MACSICLQIRKDWPSDHSKIRYLSVLAVTAINYNSRSGAVVKGVEHILTNLLVNI